MKAASGRRLHCMGSSRAFLHRPPGPTHRPPPGGLRSPTAPSQSLAVRFVSQCSQRGKGPVFSLGTALCPIPARPLFNPDDRPAWVPGCCLGPRVSSLKCWPLPMLYAHPSPPYGSRVVSLACFCLEAPALLAPCPSHSSRSCCLLNGSCPLCSPIHCAHLSTTLVCLLCSPVHHTHPSTVLTYPHSHLSTTLTCPHPHLSTPLPVHPLTCPLCSPVYTLTCPPYSPVHCAHLSTSSPVCHCPSFFTHYQFAFFSALTTDQYFLICEFMIIVSSSVGMYVHQQE